MKRVEGTSWYYADVDADARAYKVSFVFKGDGEAYEKPAGEGSMEVEFGPTPDEFVEIMKMVAVEDAAKMAADSIVDSEMRLARVRRLGRRRDV